MSNSDYILVHSSVSGADFQMLLPIWYDIFCSLELGCHRVAVVQYTITHKQYTEQNETEYRTEHT